MITTHRRRAVLAAAACLALASALRAHEDDPKVRDRKSPVPGPGLTAGAFGRGGGFAFAGASPFQAEGAILLAWMPLSEFGSPANGNDCWGYVSPSGREYALFCHYDGMHVVEVTQPADPVIVGYVNGPDSLWRDVKVHGDHAYVVSEGGSGIQVVDLSQVDQGQVTLVGTVTAGGTSASHNVALDPESGFLYRCGGGSEGIRFYDLAVPAAPVYAGEWSERYVHDAQVRTFTSGPYAGRQIAFCCSGFNGGFTSTGISIVDVTDKQNPVHRGQVTWPGSKFSHQCWLSEDGLTLYVNDELDEDGSFPTTTYIIDVSDLDAPLYKGSFTNGNTAVGHNLYVKGDLVYEANYRSGLRVFDASDPLAPVEVAWFDTDPTGDGASFNGLWSNYPYLPSGVVIASDLERGLFVLWVGEAPVSLAVVGGAPELLDPAGAAVAVTLAEVAPGDYAPGTAMLHFDAGAGAVSTPLTDLGGGSFTADFPVLPCGSSVAWYLTAESAAGVTWVEPANGALFHSTVAGGAVPVLADDFETDQGWAVGAPEDDAVTGIWTRGDPIGTAAQPADGHGGPESACYFTGQGSIGGGVGENDVDGGRTSLTSPALDLSGVVDPLVSFWLWYSNDQGAAPESDVFRVEVSGDAGASWVTAETVGPTGDVHGGWIRHQFRLADHVAPTAAVHVRFVASDEGAGSIVEAAVDDVEVFGVQCADCNGNGLADDQEIASGTLLDLDGEGTPDECQPLSADTGVLSAAGGGTVVFTLAGGAVHAGSIYFLLGSLAGTDPGFDVGPVHVPLVQDAYFQFTLAHPSTPPLVASVGMLDATGAGAAQLVLPPGVPGLSGMTAHHAWVAVDPITSTVGLASNALPLAFE